MRESWVFDASVFVRAVIDAHDGAQERLRAAEARRVSLHVPDLVWAEVGQALWKEVRAKRVAAADAEQIGSWLARYPARTEPLQHLLPAALSIALGSTLTVYDACYLALAAAAKATLVTFDNDFIGLYDRVELLS